MMNTMAQENKTGKICKTVRGSDENESENIPESFEGDLTDSSSLHHQQNQSFVGNNKSREMKTDIQKETYECNHHLQPENSETITNLIAYKTCQIPVANNNSDGSVAAGSFKSSPSKHSDDYVYTEAFQDSATEIHSTNADNCVTCETCENAVTHRGSNNSEICIKPQDDGTSQGPTNNQNLMENSETRKDKSRLTFTNTGNDGYVRVDQDLVSSETISDASQTCLYPCYKVEENQNTIDNYATKSSDTISSLSCESNSLCCQHGLDDSNNCTEKCSIYSTASVTDTVSLDIPVASDWSQTGDERLPLPDQNTELFDSQLNAEMTELSPIQECSGASQLSPQSQEIKLPENPCKHSEALEPTIHPKQPIKCTCRFRSSNLRLHPPCYHCSTTDQPPKYKEREHTGWKKTKKKLLFTIKTFNRMNFLQQSRITSCDIEAMNNLPFTISNGRFFEPANTTTSADNDIPSTSATSPSPNPTDNFATTVNGFSSHPNDAQQMETENSATENARLNGESPLPISQRAAESPSEAFNGSAVLQLMPSHPPAYPAEEGSRVPPPYSPPLEASRVSGNIHANWVALWNRQLELERAEARLANKCCSRHSVVWSVLLGTMTALVSFGMGPPWSLTFFGIFFFSFIVYLPCLWLVENFLRINCQGRNPTGGRVSFPSAAAPSIHPYIA